MTIADNIASVQAQITAACVRVGRDPASVTLIAVSKTHPPETILEAVQAGLQHFGENRVEESSTKIPAVAAQTNIPLMWHMIGHLQSRKAKEVQPLFDVVHSIDTIKLADKLNAAIGEDQRRLKVLLEINVSGEASKEGFAAHGWEDDPGVLAALCAGVRQIAALPRLEVRGLMTMAPIVEDSELARPVFASLRRLRDALQNELGIALPDLSMGMTDDFPVAVEEGATMVRVGRAIFGERRPLQ